MLSLRAYSFCLLSNFFNPSLDFRTAIAVKYSQMSDYCRFIYFSFYFRLPDTRFWSTRKLMQ